MADPQYGDPPVGAYPAPDGGAEPPHGASVSFEIPASMVGKLIGRSGETIRNLQLSTDTRIQVDHEGGGETRRITISGLAQEAVERCRSEIESLTGEEEVQETMECPQGIVGRIIGRGGETIRALQSASQAHITVDQNFPEGHPRKIIISGAPEAARRASALINELIVGEAGSAQAIIQRVCAEQGIGRSQTFSVPKGIVGRIIGRGGETIKQIQRATQATVQIDQAGDPCNVTIGGQPSAVESARRMVDDIVAGLDPFGGAPPGGGGGYAGYGGYGAAGGGYGGYGAAGGYGTYQAAYPAYGGYYGGYGVPGVYSGYGGYPAAAAGADPYAAYGGAAAYGGYAAYGQQAGAGQASGGTPTSAGVQPPPQHGGAWQELHDDQGRPYYYNAGTGVTQWEKPADF